MMAAACGIYAITHVASGKRYIGQSVNMDDRIRHHRNQLDSGKHKNVKLARAYAKYGSAAFRFDRVIVVAPEHLTFYEQLLIDGYDSARSGFNIAPAAESVRGSKRTPEQCARISQAQIESRKRPEVILAMSAAIKASRARPDVIQAISSGTKAAMNRPETKAKFMAAIRADEYRTPRLEKARSLEQRERVSRSVKVAYADEAVRARHRAACSMPEYKAKLTAYYADPATKLKKAEAAARGWLKRRTNQ